MSLLNKTPVLDAELSKLSGEQLKSLKSLMNGEGATSKKTISQLTSGDKIKRLDLELEDHKGLISGYMLDDSFIQVFLDRPEMQLYLINLSNKTSTVVNEPFTATDLRYIIEDKLVAAGEGDYVSEEEMEHYVSGAIEASQDIISQIVIQYDSDDNETKLIFPKGILPIEMYFRDFESESNLYFNYYEELVYNGDSKEFVGSLSFEEVSTGIYKIAVTFEGDLREDVLEELLYINSSNGSGFGINFYDILNPFTPETFFTRMTHSFAELDSTLRGIIDAAILDGGQSGVACTLHQWQAIKNLLDKSLYLYYSDTSLIKTLSNGINNYVFGSGMGQMVGRMMEINYDTSYSKLYILISEI